MGDEACRGAWHFARVSGSLITDSAAGEPLVTIDVDARAEILSYAQYAAFGERLRSLGFSEDTTPGAPVCRWVQRSVILDVMPLDESILGFSNRWYRASMKAAVVHRISADLDIRVVTAPYFLATKLEAIRGRGQGDLFASTHSNGKAITIPSHADHCLVGRYFAALDLERQMPVLHEVMDARTAGQSLDKVVELQEHAGLLEILILGVYAAEIAHLFTATAHETHFGWTLVYLVLSPILLGGTAFLCRETKRWRLRGPVGAAIVVVVCGVGLSVLAHGAKEQKLRQESEAREKAATEERTRLDKKQTERDERMWQEVGLLREEVRQLGGKRLRSQAKR